MLFMKWRIMSCQEQEKKYRTLRISKIEKEKYVRYAEEWNCSHGASQLPVACQGCRSHKKGKGLRISQLGKGGRVC